MGAENIAYWNVALLLVFIIPIFIINIKLKVNINQSLVFAIIRMFIQLSLVGVYLQYIFQYNNPFINIGYIFIMIGVASISIIQSCKLKLSTMIFSIYIALMVPIFIVIIYFNYVVIRVDYLFDAKYLITIGGMLLGNCLSGTIIGLNSFYTTLRDHEKEYYYTLSLGASRIQALMPYFRRSIKESMKPSIASMATIGLVSLPGMMTGQILGGSLPWLAIKYQIAIMIAIFVVKYFSVFLGLLLTFNQAFDGYDRVNRKIFR